MTYWKRKIEIEYQGVRITEPKIQLDLKFEIDDTPTNGTVAIYNLSRDTERELNEAGEMITVRAGYEGQVGTLITGSVQRIEKLREPLTRVVKFHLTSQSISKETLSGTTDKTWEGDISAREIVSDIIRNDMGLQHGPLDLIPESAIVTNFTWSGSSNNAIRQFITHLGLTIHEDADGVLQVNEPTKKSTVANDLTLNETNGLIESPSVTDEGVRMKSLLNPNIRIGTVIALESEFVTGSYKAVSVVHRGSNWDGSFVTEIDSRAV